MCIGTNNTSNVPDWIQLAESVKILGIYYHNNSRTMMNLNWDNVIQKLKFSTWNNQFRNLNLIQKVIFLNTFASSRIWYVSSVVPLDKKRNAKIRNIYGNFLWYRATLRVAFDQLCLPRKRGGLGLIAPNLKSNALLLNRFLRLESESPFLHNLTNQIDNPPNIKDVPLNSPFLKTVYLELPYIPENIRQNSTANALYNHYIARLPTPHIEQKYPQCTWQRIWKNVFNKKIISENLFCPQEIEDWKHRYANCEKVRKCWWYSLTQIKLINRNRTRNLSFDDFKFPVLSRLNMLERTEASKIFIEYLNYIKSRSREELDLSELVFNLNCKT